MTTDQKTTAAWVEGKYGVHHFHAVGFRGSVGWSMTGGGFDAHFNGWNLREKFKDLDTAKQAVEALARMKAYQLLNALGGN